MRKKRKTKWETTTLVDFSHVFHVSTQTQHIGDGGFAAVVRLIVGTPGSPRLRHFLSIQNFSLPSSWPFFRSCFLPSCCARMHPKPTVAQTEPCVSCIVAKRMAPRRVNSNAAQREQMNECSLAAWDEKRAREICPCKILHSAQLHANGGESFIPANRVKCLIDIPYFFGSKGNNWNAYLHAQKCNTERKCCFQSRQKESCGETSILSGFNCHKCFRDAGQPHIFHFNDAVDKEKSPCFQWIDGRMQMRLECI